MTAIPPWSSSNVLNFDALQTKSKEVLRSYLVYILEQRLSDPSVCDISELRSCVQILTNKGPVNPTNNSIYFTKKFGNTIDLARQLSSKNFFLFPFLISHFDFFNLLSFLPCLPIYGMELWNCCYITITSSLSSWISFSLKCEKRWYRNFHLFFWNVALRP